MQDFSIECKTLGISSQAPYDKTLKPVQVMQ
jgi:hypothetical protein